MAADAIAIAGQHGIEFSEQPRHGGNRHQNAEYKRERHSQEYRSEGVGASVDLAVRKCDVQRFLTIETQDIRVAPVHFVGLIGERFETLQPVETVKPRKVAGADVALAVVDYEGLGGHRHYYFSGLRGTAG